MTDLAARQQALVRALVAGGPVPSGLPADRIDVERRALLRKRLRAVAGHWPVLLHDVAAQDRFVSWADGRPPTTSHADGLAFAKHLESAGLLTPQAAAELVGIRRRARGGGLLSRRRR